MLVPIFFVVMGMLVNVGAMQAAVGFGLIFLVQIGLAAAAFHARARYGLSAQAFSALFPMLMLSDSFPFLIWAVVANEFVRDVGRRAVARVAPDRPEPGDAKRSNR